MIDYKFTIENYHGAMIHGKPGIMGKYVRHNVDVTAELKGYTFYLQTACTYYGNDYDLPKETLEIYCDEGEELISWLIEDALVIDFDDEELPEIINTFDKFIRFQQDLEDLEEAANSWFFSEIEGKYSNDPDDYEPPCEYGDGYWSEAS